MRKGKIIFPLLLAAALTLTACQDKPAPTPSVQPTVTTATTMSSEPPAFAVAPNASIAFLSSGDNSFFDTQVWAGIQAYCLSNDKKCVSYAGNPSDNATVEKAIAAGHQIVAVSGTQWGSVISSLRGKYPETAFLLFNDSSKTSGAAQIGVNTVSLSFDETQLGYLAGCAAVGEGYTRLGFLGNADDPAQIRYGYGFVQGANDAAQAAGITVNLLYYYVDSLSTEPTPTENNIADLWYRSGIQLIFTAGASENDLVIPAAEENGGKVITAQGPLARQSAAVVATVELFPDQAVSRVLSGTFPGGQDLTLGCVEQAVGLDFSRMSKFGQYDYEHAYGKLAAGTVNLLRDDAVQSPDQLPVSNVTVSFIEG